MPIQVQLCAPTAQSAPQSFKVYCQVARGVRGGAGLTIHSGIRLHNSCGVLLSIGMQQRWPGGVSQEGESARTTKLVAAGDSLWLPALCCKASYLSLQPAGNVGQTEVLHVPSSTIFFTVKLPPWPVTFDDNACNSHFLHSSHCLT